MSILIAAGFLILLVTLVVLLWRNMAVLSLIVASFLAFCSALLFHALASRMALSESGVGNFSEVFTSDTVFATSKDATVIWVVLIVAAATVYLLGRAKTARKDAAAKKFSESNPFDEPSSSVYENTRDTTSDV